MEKKTIIWHTRDEEPKDFADVVLLNSKTGDFTSFFTPFPNFSFEYDQWAYTSDLVVASKALDVARETLLEISGYDIIKADAQTVRNIFEDSKYAADNALQEIENLMEGDK